MPFEGTNVSVGRGTENNFKFMALLTKSDFSLLLNQIWAHKILFIMEYFVMANLSNYSRLNQLELKWLIKAYQTTRQIKILQSFFTNLQELKITTAKRSRISEDKIREAGRKD
jgi:hypothetical protein